VSASRKLKPEQILALWEKANFTLSESLKAQFLSHPTMSQLINFDHELVSSAICQEKIMKLDDVLKFLNRPVQINQVPPKPKVRLARQYFRDALSPLEDYFGDGSRLTTWNSGPTLEFEYEEREFPEGEVIKYQKKSREGMLCHLCGARVEKGRCNCSHT